MNDEEPRLDLHEIAARCRFKREIYQLLRIKGYIFFPDFTDTN